MKGPGQTRWYISEDGDLHCVWRNDPSVDFVVKPASALSTQDIPDLLATAYRQGREDQAELVRMALLLEGPRP